MRASRWSSIVLIALLAGCDSLAGPGDAGVALEVTATHLDPADATYVIDYRVENRGSEAVYLTPRCGDSPNPSIYGEMGSGWTLVGGGVCLAIFDMSPWRLGPGETVSGSTGWRSEGTYELRLDVSDGHERRTTIRSEAFRLD